ncbi:MAG TPA: hypothetical protein VM915_03325 [Verrucomicrobiae bacterium]|nr:hypothetical protein [Verrucomicrobiae bacterium]
MRGIWIVLSLLGVVLCTLIFGALLAITYVQWQETGVLNSDRLGQALPVLVFGCVCGWAVFMKPKDIQRAMNEEERPAPWVEDMRRAQNQDHRPD